MKKQCTVEEAAKAQKALRAAAGLGAEQFSAQAFVGMTSDEIEILRKRGESDEDIATLVRESCAIEITAQGIDVHCAPPEVREPHGRKGQLCSAAIDSSYKSGISGEKACSVT